MNHFGVFFSMYYRKIGEMQKALDYRLKQYRAILAKNSINKINDHDTAQLLGECLDECLQLHLQLPTKDGAFAVQTQIGNYKSKFLKDFGDDEKNSEVCAKIRANVESVARKDKII
eukprot:UN27396